MQHEATFDYVSVNGKMERVGETSFFERVTGSAIYEVIRVVNGNPMFLEDHLERMYGSAELADFNLTYDADEIRDHVIRLIGANGIVSNNIKLLATTDDSGKELFMAYAVESFYPPEDYYRNGIKVILFNHQRDNPNAKVQHSDFRQRVKDAMNREDAFEALLVNEEGHILEGSRSNMFYILEGKLYTAPASDVLLGITRKHIIALSLRLGYPVHERRLHRNELGSVQGLFVSGTSIGVLPVSKVDNMDLPTMENEIIKKLVEGYKSLMSDLS
ncbi:aminotransferase class IV [Gudongella sp. SC589]|jgi:branched-chain amino acid aminotransferase|uniref:aminotransferase class IV n=1 Tax=Gudongella sp. SC589 TaxID=3385990 RepID=UPI003904D82C